MKRYFLPLSFFSLLFVGFSFLFAGSSFAQESFKIMPMPDQPTQYGGSSFGQNHSYSVLFRGNGEAVVSLKVNFTNYDSQPVSTLRYKLPANTEIRNVLVYQVDSTSTKSPCYYPLDSYSPTPTPAIEQFSESGAMPSLIAPCQYDQYDPYMYGNTYKRADFQVEGENVTVTLPVPIYMNQTGNFFITFRTMSLVRKNVFGTFLYSFETLKTEDSIASLQIGASAEQEYIIREQKGQTNYQGAAMYPKLPTLESAGTVRNAEMDTFYSMIGQGAVYKYASSLAPNESYTLKGVYANSTWKLYIKEILIGLLIVEIVGVIIVIGMMKLIRVLRNTQATSQKTGIVSGLSGQQQTLLWGIGGSFAISLAIVVYTFFFFFLTMVVSSNVGYSEFGTVLVLLTLLISLGVYVCLFFGFVLFFGLRKGLKWGIAVFIMQIGWLVLFTAFIFSILFTARYTHGYPVMSVPPMNVGVDSSPVMR